MTEHNNRFGLELALGKDQAYPDQYDASLLQSIPRSVCREKLPKQDFSGVDIWTGYELSWLDAQGKPNIAIAEFTIPASSPYIIESKSFKYYLNSFNQCHIDSWSALQKKLKDDLSTAAGEPVDVSLTAIDHYIHPPSKLEGFECVDNYPLGTPQYEPKPKVLAKLDNYNSDKQMLCSHLLKSNCPVTNQPDWASVWVMIEGAAVTQESFLRYIVGYRGHQDFHENCVEQIFCDLSHALQPKNLWVYARYTRRGGLDINPFRSTQIKETPPPLKGARQ